MAAGVPEVGVEGEGSLEQLGGPWAERRCRRLTADASRAGRVCRCFLTACCAAILNQACQQKGKSSLARLKHGPKLYHWWVHVRMLYSWVAAGAVVRPPQCMTHFYLSKPEAKLSGSRAIETCLVTFQPARLTMHAKGAGIPGLRAVLNNIDVLCSTCLSHHSAMYMCLTSGSQYIHIHHASSVTP